MKKDIILSIRIAFSIIIMFSYFVGLEYWYVEFFIDKFYCNHSVLVSTLFSAIPIPFIIIQYQLILLIFKYKK